MVESNQFGKVICPGNVIFQFYLGFQAKIYRLADINVREKIQIFQKLLKVQKIIIEAWFFYCFVKKLLQNFMQKTDLSYL